MPLTITTSVESTPQQSFEHLGPYSLAKVEGGDFNKWVNELAIHTFIIITENSIGPANVSSLAVVYIFDVVPGNTG